MNSLATKSDLAAPVGLIKKWPLKLRSHFLSYYSPLNLTYYS